MRYGHQPFDAIERMTVPTMIALCDEIMTIVDLENKSGKTPEGE